MCISMSVGFLKRSGVDYLDTFLDEFRSLALHLPFAYWDMRQAIHSHILKRLLQVVR